MTMVPVVPAEVEAAITALKTDVRFFEREAAEGRHEDDRAVFMEYALILRAVIDELRTLGGFIGPLPGVVVSCLDHASSSALDAGQWADVRDLAAFLAARL